MDKRFMEKTTFSEICKMMKNGDAKDGALIKNILDVGAIFLPTLVSPETTLLMNLSTGADLLSIKSAIGNIRSGIKDFLTQGQVDFVSKYERAQAAQVLLILSAYFDTMKQYIPDETNAISISKEEKITITDKALAAYTERISKQRSNQNIKVPRSIMDYDLDFQAPLETEQQFKERLSKFYELLNEEFIKFISNLSFTERLTGTDRDHFMASLRIVPKQSLNNYYSQFFELQNLVPSFCIWANNQAHTEIINKIDVGFEDISRRIDKFIVAHCEQGIQTIENYVKLYKGYIEEELVKTQELDTSHSSEVEFPAKKDIFVPQKFKALSYQKEMSIENEGTWKYLEEKENIGVFITDTLHHSTTGKLPLLILGTPGAGKTLLSYMLAAQILSHEYHVIIIRLRDIVAENTITQQINEQIENDFANQCNWDQFVKGSLSTPILLIFDGYDELLQASGKTYSDYITKIVEFQKNQLSIYGIQVKCLLTSRITLIDKVTIPKGTTIIRLSEFDPERINLWTSIWNDVNSTYFSKHGIEKFSIDSTSKVYDLAKQPLLLLLLALYDSKGNALKLNIELTGAQLYDSLIRDFIEREQRKNANFLNYTEADRKKTVNRELQKISIAALGMYNRRVLFTRDDELEKDLGFLLNSGEEDIISTEYGRLNESDMVLGRFFFIYRSHSKSTDSKDNKNSAYEFLHNTFGEFLTARFIVNELYEKIRFTSQLQINDMMSNWSLPPTRGWVVSLSYSALSSRPNVVKMISEWVNSYFQDKALDREKVLSALNYILKTEIHCTISGKDIFVLDKILSENGNPFEKKEYLMHLACYSLNLIILGTLVCGDIENIFSIKNESWNKLTCLWRYAFQEEELLALSSGFVTHKYKNAKEEELCCLMYSPNEEDYGTNIMKLERISQAIGDTQKEALVSTILGDGDSERVLELLEQNNFELAGTYLVNKLLRTLRERTIVNVREISELLRVFEGAYVYDNYVQNLLVYYLLLNSMLNRKMIVFTETGDTALRGILMPGILLLRDRGGGFTEETRTIEMMRDAICSLIEQLLLNYLVDVKEVADCLYGTTDPILAFRIVGRVLKLERSWKLPRGKTKYLFNYLELERILYDIKTAYQVINDGEQFFDVITVVNVRRDTLHAFLQRIFSDILLREIRYDYQKLSAIIRLCKLAKDNGIYLDYARYIKLSKVSIRSLFCTSPNVAYDFCCLICKAFVKELGYKNDLEWILRNYGQEIPVKFYWKIKELLSDNGLNTEDEKLADKHQVINYNPNVDLLGSTVEMFVLERGGRFDDNLRGIADGQYKVVIPRNYLRGIDLERMINKRIKVKLEKINNEQYEAKPIEPIQE